MGAHAEGLNTQALGMASHAEGDNTVAGLYAQHVEGTFNVIDTVSPFYDDDETPDEEERGHYIHIAGNGGTKIGRDRSNAYTLD